MGRWRVAVPLYVGFGCVVVLLSVLLWWQVWIGGDPRSTITCQCGDPGQYLWFIEWVPWSISHLHNPFLSQAIYAGQGGSNTLELSDLLPPLLVWPVTALYGPIAAFNLLVTLVPVVNGLAMLFFLRRVTSFVPGQLIGSLFYSFLPYVMHDDPFGHFNIDLLFFPPLALWCVYELVAGGRHRPAAVGAFFGLLVVAQFLTGPEILAMSLLLGLFGGAAILLFARRLVVANFRRIGAGLAVAAVLAGALLAYPLWFVLAGPRHVVGYPWPTTPYTGTLTTGVLHIGSTAPSYFNQVGGYFGNLIGSDSLGIAVVIAVGVTCPIWFRRPLARTAAVVGILGWAFSLGVMTNGPFTRVGPWTPWRLFYRLPVVSEVTPSRFALFSDLAAAVILAVTLDVCWQNREAITGAVRSLLSGIPVAVGNATSRARRVLSAGVGVACCLGALAVVAPIAGGYLSQGTFAVHNDPEPPWFIRDAPNLEVGTILLTMPDPSSGAAQAMAWQADEDFRFSMIGGRAQVPGKDGIHSIHGDPPGGTELVLDQLSWGTSPEPKVSGASETSMRSDLARWGVQLVVVTGQSRSPWYVVAFLTAVLGRSPTWQDGAWVWRGLGDAAPLQITEGALRHCKLFNAPCAAPCSGGVRAAWRDRRVEHVMPDLTADLTTRVESAPIDPDAAAVLAACEGHKSLADLLFGVTAPAQPAASAVTTETNATAPTTTTTAATTTGATAANTATTVLAGDSADGHPVANGVFLQSISVEGFRGIGPEAHLNLMPGPGLTLVVGRNGSGKSSFAEALELLLTRSNKRWAQRSAGWREDWRNVHHPARTAIHAEVTVSHHQGPTTIETVWQQGAGLDDHETTAQFKGERRGSFSDLGWDAALNAYRPVLSYNELGSILDDGPSKLFDALSQVLGVEEVVEIAGNLDWALKDFAQDEKRLKVSAAALLEGLDSSDDERAAPAAAALRRRGGADLGALEDASAGARDDGAPSAEERISALHALAALQGPRLDDVETVAARLRSAAQAVATLEQSDSGLARSVAAMLGSALDYHGAVGDGDCPVCSTPLALDTAWRRAAEERVASLRRAAAAADEAEGELDAARRAAEDIAQPPPDTLAAGARRESWISWHALRDEADPRRRADLLEELAVALDEQLQGVRTAAAAELSTIEDSWRPLRHEIAQYVGDAHAVASRATLARHLKQASDWVQATANEMRNERFAPIAAEAKAIWSMLRHQSNVDLEDILLTGKKTGRKVVLEVTVDGVAGAALGVMSQGELHALALSLFLPRATMEESPFRFVVIDDPVQSMDPARVDGLARVLERVSEQRQVVVFTHDERLAEAVRRLQVPARILQVNRAAQSAVEVRSVSDPADRALDDAVALMHTGELTDEVRRRVVPGFCRIAIEARCTDIVRRRRLARGEPYSDVENALVDAERLGAKVGLALKDDAHMRNDDLGELIRRRFGKKSADAYFDSNRGAHQALQRPLEDFVADVKVFVRDLGEVT